MLPSSTPFIAAIATVLLANLPASAGPIKFSGNSAIDINALSAVTVTLNQEEDVLVPAPEGRSYQLGQINAKNLSPAAISAILRSISELYQERGILATRAVVTLPGYQAMLKGEPLEIKIVEGKITKTRVVGTKDGQELTQSKRDRIAGAAPIGVGETISAKELDGTVGLMNRFSRQQVRPVLVPEQGDLVLEYRVKQLDEQIASFTMDNYGSDRTGSERVTLDFTRWNLLTADDKFNFKALSSFEGNSRYVGADYLLPLDDVGSSRLGFNVSYSNYTAEDIGLGGAVSLDFEGHSFTLGSNWEKTIWHDKGQYLDAIVGMRYLAVSQDQTSVGIPEANTGFLLPSLGLRYSRTTINSSLIAGTRLETNLSRIAGTDSGVELSQQGRLFADDSFHTGSLYASYRLYLDEWLTDEEGRKHEFLAFASANTSFGSRLPPSFLNVAGGYQTVRGYPLGAASGDDSFILKLDYKHHFDEMKLADVPVKLSATVFSDFASVNNQDALPFEQDDSLWSVGLGVEAVVNEDLQASMGYGIALRDIMISTESIDSGDGEFYFQVSHSF